MSLPHITKKQFEILTLIYSYRFINRIHIQTILNHKNHRRIHAWLNDLGEKECIGRIYSKKMPENTKPAVYFLGKYGRKILQKHFSELKNKEGKNKPDKIALYQLTKTYKDNQRTEVFRLSCLALVDISITTTAYGIRERVHIAFRSLTECAKTQLIEKFDSYVRVQKKNGKKKRYAFLYISNRTPRRFIRYRIAEIIKLLDREWDSETDIPRPVVLCICSNFSIRNYACKIYETKMKYYKRTDKQVTFRLTTLHEYKTQGLGGSYWLLPKTP
ncbi:MAG TPA: hypothetical protein VGT05_00190 [Patescibacteria group bacterium]|nr:hypothetical protein [Patescibacteria group bacterium]